LAIENNNLLQQCAKLESQLQFVTKQDNSNRFQKEDKRLDWVLARAKSKLQSVKEKLLLQMSEIEELGNHFR
jgi:hypothetical protein